MFASRTGRGILSGWQGHVLLSLSVIARDFVKTKKEWASGLVGGAFQISAEKSGMVGGENRRVAVENPGNIGVTFELLIEESPDFLA